MQESQWWLSESTDVWDPRVAGQVWQLDVYFWWSTEGPKWRETGYRRSLPHKLKLKFRSVFGAHAYILLRFLDNIPHFKLSLHLPQLFLTLLPTPSGFPRTLPSPHHQHFSSSLVQLVSLVIGHKIFYRLEEKVVSWNTNTENIGINRNEPRSKYFYREGKYSDASVRYSMPCLLLVCIQLFEPGI